MNNKPAWTLQDAKARFSAVVEAALQGEAQVVTRRGKTAVVVLAATEYERFVRGERAQAPGFIEHLLAMPREASVRKRERAEVKLRDVNFR